MNENTGAIHHDKVEENFIEKRGVKEANTVDFKKYTFVGYSNRRDVYVFKLREELIEEACEPREEIKADAKRD